MDIRTWSLMRLAATVGGALGSPWANPVDDEWPQYKPPVDEPVDVEASMARLRRHSVIADLPEF